MAWLVSLRLRLAARTRISWFRKCSHKGRSRSMASPCSLGQPVNSQSCGLEHLWYLSQTRLGDITDIHPNTRIQSNHDSNNKRKELLSHSRYASLQLQGHLRSYLSYHHYQHCLTHWQFKRFALPNDTQPLPLAILEQSMLHRASVRDNARNNILAHRRQLPHRLLLSVRSEEQACGAC